MKLKNNYSICKIWWNQLKTIGKELLRLLQKYAQSMNEKQNHVLHESEKMNFEQRMKNKENYEYTPKTTKLKSKTKENYEDPWTKSWNNDIDLVNDLFGFDKSKKKGKSHQNNDYGFNMEDFFS